MKKIISILILATLLMGCKTRHIIKENTVTKIDSTLVKTLEAKINSLKEQKINLQVDLKETKEQNSKLENKSSTHVVIYDTTAIVVDGKYPIAKETKTESKTKIEDNLKEQKKENKVLNSRIRSLIQKNKNLQYSLTSAKEENKQLKDNKETDSFSLKSFTYGLIAGVIILGVVILFFKFK